MTVILTRNSIALEDAVKAIKKHRPDFKIGAIFKYDGHWHAVHDAGNDSVDLICVKVEDNGNVIGVYPFSKEIDKSKFFKALNDEAFDQHGKPMKDQRSREMEISPLPSFEMKRVSIKELFK